MKREKEELMVTFSPFSSHDPFNSTPFSDFGFSDLEKMVSVFAPSWFNDEIRMMKNNESLDDTYGFSVVFLP